jgi:hypothetical protein
MTIRHTTVRDVNLGQTKRAKLQRLLHSRLLLQAANPLFALGQTAGLDTSLGQTKVYRTATNAPQFAVAAGGSG